MPKSRNRGGHKAHRLRVKNRNIRLKEQENKMRKAFEEQYAKMLEEAAAQSGDTVNNEEEQNLNINL